MLPPSNYEQIGLKFKLFSAEIMFNKGHAQVNLGYAEGGISDKITDVSTVLLTQVIRDRGEGPDGVLYRPSENKHQGF
ncbi:hypothetical protein J3R83DRAFT_9666 [Lanmaoa asiatica]|nr:hypothetical protein J3R83DRAFT_9666 [Lanmaoa asiatica]